ncbi:MAG: zinc-binding dehydrogenase [Actinomycetota bacterium]|jgi:NADPH:quinone reductase-like Zn-dependent oxidoreductase|nr:zinc-binding dehydrogenase [Actinomycetota bacterium]
MRAAYVSGPGPAESIRYGELPLPEPGPTDYLVRIAAVAANPVDTFVRSGAYQTAMPTPFVVGRDLVGEVIAAGSGATAYSRGQKVWSNSLGHAGRQGSFSEYAFVPGDRLYAVPHDLDPTQLVAVAFAAAAGARVIASARADDLDFVSSLGATEVIDYASSDAAQRIDRAASGGYDLYLDTSGTAEPAVAIDRLASGGRLVVMAGLHATPTVPLGRLYTRDASIVGFAISNAPVTDLADAAHGVTRLLHTTPWQPRIAEILELSETARAHRLLDEHQVKGRLVLRP